MRVVYIDIDSLRPDHLGCYGYRRPTSPNIDRLAQQGIRFERAYTTDSPCMPSRAALISGMPGIKSGVVTHGARGERLNRQYSSLGFVLRQNRIPAAAITSFGRHPSPWFYVGWNEFLDPIDRPELSFQQIDGREVVDRALTWLEDHRDTRDFYLYVQMWDPHSVYEAPELFVERARGDHYPAHPTEEQVRAHQQDSFWHSAPAMGIRSHEDWRRMIDEYDGEVRYADHQVGRLLEALKPLEEDGDLVVILAADHGEEHGEHGLYVEHWSVHDGTQRIPLIVRDSRRKQQAGTFGGLVYQIDITATICDAFGIEPPGHWDGVSLLRQAAGEVPARTHIVVGHGLYTAQRAVVTPEWKFIRTYHPGIWEIPQIQLFAHNDAWEQHNVADEHPDVVRELDHLLRGWEERQRGRSALDPMMVNAAETPHGATYADSWTRRYQQDGVPMPVRFERRKPDPRA